MGYKLAGFDVLGGVEIDPEMMNVYRKNHNPKHSYLMGVQEFKDLPDADIPQELFNLDILDGSPPCSTFSMAGSREKKWGGEHHFREGQAAQRLDDLFFDFIDIAKKLKPKVVVAENVKGLIIGNAKGYVKQIFREFDEAGYTTQLFLLNAAAMGVPQRRERTFFIAVRKDIAKAVKFEFCEEPIPFSKIDSGDFCDDQLSKTQKLLWAQCQPGENYSKYHPKGNWFTHYKLDPKLPLQTITANSSDGASHHIYPRKLTSSEKRLGQTFPEDYDFQKIEVRYLVGMSVPPFMTQRVALEIGRQVFGVEYDTQIIDNFVRV